MALLKNKSHWIGLDFENGHQAIITKHKAPALSICCVLFMYFAKHTMTFASVTFGFVVSKIMTTFLEKLNYELY